MTPNLRGPLQRNIYHRQAFQRLVHSSTSVIISVALISSVSTLRKRVRTYHRLPSHGELHKLRGSVKARQEYVEPGAGKHRVLISLHDDGIVSISPRAIQIFTYCGSCTCGNNFSQRSLPISETRIKSPTAGTHMHPTAI